MMNIIRYFPLSLAFFTLTNCIVISPAKAVKYDSYAHIKTLEPGIKQPFDKDDNLTQLTLNRWAAKRGFGLFCQSISTNFNTNTLSSSQSKEFFLNNGSIIYNEQKPDPLNPESSSSVQLFF